MLKFFKRLKNRLLAGTITPTDAIKELALEIDDDGLLADLFADFWTDWGGNIVAKPGKKIGDSGLYFRTDTGDWQPLDVNTAVDMIDYLISLREEQTKVATSLIDNDELFKKELNRVLKYKKLHEGDVYHER